MLKIIAVDASAEARTVLVDRLHQLLGAAGSALEILPRIDIQPRSLEELRFQDAPPVCVVGPLIIESQLPTIGSLRSKLPDSALVACLRSEHADLSTIEQLGRYGIDDTMTLATQPEEFLRKLVLLARRNKKAKSGKLILVDSGKGGLGVTTIAAALADALVSKEYSVTLVDFDFEGQALSRFLQCRPFLNESLQLLFERQRPVSEEFVEQCLTNLWQHGRGALSCMTPTPESEEIDAQSSNYARVLLSVLEVLDSRSDFVIVDPGCVRGALLRTLYRVADKVVFVTSNDPAALYASTERFTKLRSLLAAGAEAILVSNAPTNRGLRSGSLVSEFNRSIGVRDTDWALTPIPYCAAGQRWPGSGLTLYSQGSRAARKAIDNVLGHIGVSSFPSIECTATTSLVRAGKALLRARQPSALRPSLPAAAVRSALPEPERLLMAPVERSTQLSESDEARLLITPAVVS